MEKINPRLVRVSITHFGKSGPYVAFAANDFICLALGGLMSISGEPDKAPLVAPGELAYALASSYAAFGTTVALFHSLSSGRGQLVEVSVHEASALIAGYAVPIYTATGVKPFRQSWRKRLFDLYDVYPAKDGFARIFVVPKNHWQSLLDWLGRPPELTSELFNDQKLRWENSEVIDPFVERLTRQYAKEMLFHEAQRRHIAASPVNTPKEFAKSAQVKAREFFTTVTHPKVGTHVQTRPIHRYNGFPIQPARPAPTLGEHNTEVYETILNLPRKELRLLRMDGVI
jgi:crotonobetainyl-CoA:carnitine CoA-transferase CaiB-like acyl-CoA transferase